MQHFYGVMDRWCVPEGHLPHCTNVILAVGLLSIATLGVTTRGQSTPALFWLGGLPLLAVALDCPKAGYIWSVICVSVIGAFLLLAAPGVSPDATTQDFHWQSLNALSQIGLVAFALAVGVALELSRMRAARAQS